jgi:2-amino-4-hydroxy-6-hydroxymethyldihydropteridine diphosphokinase
MPTEGGTYYDYAFVVIGSNIGDTVANVRNAFGQLEALSDSPLIKSSLWLTTPVDCPSGSPDFVNAAAAFRPKPGETPETLILEMQSIERKFGRKPKAVMNEPRPLDLDIIAFCKETRNGPSLVIPHPRAHLRQFVLQPLSEIAPTLILPGQTKTVAELALALLADPAMRRLIT